MSMTGLFQNLALGGQLSIMKILGSVFFVFVIVPCTCLRLLRTLLLTEF